jgi:LacI family transcriptional regulator
MASIVEIAKLAKVSKMTVSNVIHKKYEKVSKETRERIERILVETNYTPNLFARNLKSNSSKIILFTIPQTIENDPYKNTAFNNPFYGELINSIEFNLRKSGYYLMFRFVSDEEILSNLVLNWNVDGVIILGAVKKEIRTVFKDIKVPVVFIDTYADLEESDSIVTEDEQGGFIATNHLIQRGKRKIGVVVSSIKEIGVASKRYDGYRRALKENDISFDDKWLFEGFPSFEFGAQIAQQIVEEKTAFDALFVYSDVMAIGVIKGLKEHGLRVPEDIAVVGFDGLYIGDLCEPRLTTIKQDITAKGQMAVDLLVRKLDGRSLSSEQLTLPVKLLEKESA